MQAEADPGGGGKAAGPEAGGSPVARWILAPFHDYLDALDGLRDSGAWAWVVLALAAAASWFVYVPIHELLHALGCVATGGTVTRLEIAPAYGGALLARIIPFVVSGSDYAGQLTGFDTGGNDGIYLATVLAPYLLTVFIGVPMLRRAGRPETRESFRPALAGAALPVALAPLISIPGDYYEAGSIVVTRLAAAVGTTANAAPLRSDDLFKLAGTLAAHNAGTADWVVVALSLLAALVFAFGTYHLGRRVRY